ncbi:DUF4232 domain-containing protein [Glycomyces sp. NPDC049804]|uniref:DUF4232 domain-containing protein n=1 Tax=Glycomyces sp. NPDC049804 TaxID=3154363 RepID=UPI00341ED3A6
MRRTARPLALIAAVLALAAAGCSGEGEQPPAAAATSTECDDLGVQMSLTPTGQVADRVFMAIGLVNCGTEPLLLDSIPQVGVFGGNVAAPRDANVEESITVDPGQAAVAPLSWIEATRSREVMDVDRFLINALPVYAGYELELARPVQLNTDHVLDLGSWQVAGEPAVPPAEPVAPATDLPEEPACPEGGFHVTVTQGSAAMGVRSSGIELLNCGTEDIAINGYPVIEIPGVEIEVRQGSDTLQDPGPTAITLAPGDTVSAGMLWRNRVESADEDDVVNATEIRVGYAEGSPLETVGPEASIDLGTTREIEVTAWR